MKEYSFLQEADQPANPYPANPYLQNSISFNSIFKPFSLNSITTKTRNSIMFDGNSKLQRINKLTAKLKQDASDPENKHATEDKLKLKYAMLAYKVHHEFISKSLYWRSRSHIDMGQEFLQLKEQYTRQLFTLEQGYKRETFGLNSVVVNSY